MFERMLLYNAGINVTQNGILFAVLLCLSIIIYDKRFISRFQTFFLNFSPKFSYLLCLKVIAQAHTETYIANRLPDSAH